MYRSSFLTASAILLFLTPAKADLVGHWTIDEGSGSVAADSSASGFTGTISTLGATWTTTDLPPVPAGTTAALDMDGTDGQIDIVGYKGVTGTGDRSVTAWIRTRSIAATQNKGIVSWGANIGTQKWTFRIQNSNGTPGAIRIEVNGGYFVGNTVVTDGEWHHVAVTWANDGTPDVIDAKLYVDGELDAEFGSIDSPPSASQSQAVNTASNADVRIGDDFQATHNWNGWIDDVRIYDEAIDADTIKSLAIGTPVVDNFAVDAEIVASGAPVILSWVSDPTNDSLMIDNGVGDVLGTTMTTVNPTADTTYMITGTRGGTTIERQVTVLVEKPPLINDFLAVGTETIIEGGSVRLAWGVFGAASLDLNGDDVTGESESTESPAETTTYTLTATNPWGSTTAEVTIVVLPATSPDLSWSAEGLPDGNLATWTPAINATGNNGIVFNNNTGGTVQTGVSNFSGVTQWVNSPGFNLASNPADSWHDGLGDIATKTNASWEMVFRPGDYVGTHTLFNTGGNGAGLGIVLLDNMLEFRIQNAANAGQRAFVSTDLSTFGPATDFYHIVCVADVDTAPAGTATLYVNGQPAGSVTSTGIIDDWDGGDLAELGKGNNIPGSTTFNPAAFTGDIALFNYFGRVLTDQQAADAFSDIAGAISEFQITAIEYDAAQQQIILTFNSQPGRFYAIDSSTDLTLKNWFEVDDSVESGGTETTYPIGGFALPDPAIPRMHFRVRPAEQ